MWSRKEISSFVDLTSLHSFDSDASIKEFLTTALTYKKKGFPVAAVCLYPNFSSTAVSTLKGSGIKVAVVAGNFPNSQSFLSSRLLECEIALKLGVEEIDIVLNLGKFEEKKYKEVVKEIQAFKDLMPQKTLKIILETGYLKTTEKIKKASELAVEGGADFLKTSTGKEFPGASLAAAETMAKTIIQSQKKVGLKISGGISTYEDATAYFEKIEKIMGREWMTPDNLRIGASSLIRNLMNE